MSEKKGLLPIVTEDVGLAIEQELQSKKNDYVVEVLKRLEEDNPRVINFIGTFSMRCENLLEAAYTGVIVYRLLERQAEADRMNRAYK